MASGVRDPQAKASRSKGGLWLHWSYFGLWTLYVWRLWVSNNNSNLPDGFVWQGLFGVMSAVFIVAIGIVLGSGRAGKVALAVGTLAAWAWPLRRCLWR